MPCSGLKCVLGGGFSLLFFHAAFPPPPQLLVGFGKFTSEIVPMYPDRFLFGGFGVFFLPRLGRKSILGCIWVGGSGAAACFSAGCLRWGVYERQGQSYLLEGVRRRRRSRQRRQQTPNSCGVFAHPLDPPVCKNKMGNYQFSSCECANT